MKKIALVTDSTADLDTALKKEHDVHIVPLKVNFGMDEFLDSDLSGDEFYQRLSVADQLPKTSQPSPETFNQLYPRLLQEYSEIISIHLSSGLSGTINAASLAADNFKGKIHLFDSKTISLGLGLLVIEAAKLIREGLEMSHIEEKLTKARHNIETLFTVNTLEFLQKGGRIGKVQSLVGSILNIKPLVRVGDDGIYHTYGRDRSQEKALKSIVQAFKDLARGRKPIRMAIAHGAAYQAGLYLKEMMEQAMEIPTTLFTQVGPVIGVHTGPGTIGAAVQYEN